MDFLLRGPANRKWFKKLKEKREEEKAKKKTEAVRRGRTGADLTARRREPHTRRNPADLHERRLRSTSPDLRHARKAAGATSARPAAAIPTDCRGSRTGGKQLQLNPLLVTVFQRSPVDKVCRHKVLHRDAHRLVDGNLLIA